MSPPDGLDRREPDRREPGAAADDRAAADVRFRLMVHAIREYAVYLLDPDGRVASWNEGSTRIKGYTSDEAMGQHYRMFYPPEAREAGAPEANLERAARDGRFEGEGWRQCKDGSRFWARMVITALYRDGELLGFGKFTADMTAERKARDELARRELQLEEAQEIAHLGSWEFDRESGRLNWSAELYRIADLPPGQPMDYEALLDIVHPEDRAEVRDRVEASLDLREPYVHEHRIVRPDGTVRWVQSRGELLQDSGSDTPRLVGTTLDITSLKEGEDRSRRLASEKASREEAERTAQRMGFLAEASALLGASLDYNETLRTVAWLAVPSFADWCAVDMTDPEGTLRRLAVAHLDPEQVALAEELHERYPPDPDADTGVYAALRSGEPQLITEITPEVLNRAATGEGHRAMLEQLELESALIVPIRIRDRSLGAITFIYAASGRRYTRDDLVVAQELANRAALAIENAQLHTAERDAREHAERATERTQRLQAITAELSEAVTPEAVAEVMVEHGSAALEAASGSLVLVADDGRLEMVRALGVPSDVVARYERFDRDDPMPLAEAIRSERLVMVEDLPARDPEYPPLAEGESQAGAIVAVPLRSGKGVIGSLGFGFRDQRPFTEEDQEFLLAMGHQCAQALERAWLYETEHTAREVAEAASRAKSQFVAMISHELRTPLSAIIGYQELLSEGIPGPVNDAQRQQLDRIQASATHLRDLINQILSLTRIEAGKEDVHWEPVDVVTLAEEVITLMRPEVESKGLSLDVRLPDELRLETDSGKLRQVLLNLVSNAVKFTPEGTITMGLEADEDEVRIYVADTGVGIDEADRDRIFDVFTQVDQSMTRSVGGSGLGLAVSRRLARLLEGELELESEPGEGSRFTLRLPRSSPPSRST